MKQDAKNVPLERLVDLLTLPQAGIEISIVPLGGDLVRLANWVSVNAVWRFEATVVLKKLSQTRFAYFGRFKTEVMQTCVITLEPVASNIEREFARELHLISGKGGHKLDASSADLVKASLLADDAPEEIDNSCYDVAGPLLEEFSLSIDPYPRLPNAEFPEPEDQAGKPENPFAILKRLANRD